MNLYIISAYASTTHSAEFTTEFNSIFNTFKIHIPNNSYILAGDMNARHKNWKNPVNNAKGITINSWLEAASIAFKAKLYHTSLNTFYRRNSFIDIAIADSRIQFHTNNNDNRFGLSGIPANSDHDAIKMTVSMENQDPFLIRTSTNSDRLNFAMANWSRFTRCLFHLYQIDIYI